MRRKNAPPSLESAGREHEGGTPGCASPLGRTPSSHIVERWKSYGSDMQGVDRPHHISTEALECRVRPAAGSHTKRLGEAKTVRECWGYLRRAHERWGSQARDSGASQHWGAGAVPGPGFESGKRFFSRGVFTRPKREKESDGCPPPLHPPPSGMRAYAVACMPQSTRRQLHLHRRLRFLPASPPSSKPRPPPEIGSSRLTPRRSILLRQGCRHTP